MFDSNISGLSDALNALHVKLNALEARFSRLSIMGGNNARVVKNGDQFVIDFDAKKRDDFCGWTPWSINIETYTKDQQEVFDLYVSGGLVNDHLPENINEAILEEQKPDGELWVYLEMTTNGFEIDELVVHAEKEKPDISAKFYKNSYPTTVRKLIGFVQDGELKHQFLSKNLLAHPEIAFQDTEYEDASVVDNYFTWVFIGE